MSLKVVQFNQIARRTGGASEVMHLINDAFKELGHEMIIVANCMEADFFMSPIASPEDQQRYTSSFAGSKPDTEELVYPRLRNYLRRKKADALIIHNIAGTGLTAKGISLLSNEFKVFVVLHDLNLITGGCANNTVGCERFKEGCYACPALFDEPRRQVDHSAFIWKYKRESFAEGNITFIATSEWVGRLFKDHFRYTKNKVVLVPNGVSKVFNFEQQNNARKKLGLPLDRKIILSASNGGKISPFRDYEALKKVQSHFKDSLLISIGNPQEKITENIIELPYIRDKSLLNSYYAAADVFVYPTLAETAPLVLKEIAIAGGFFVSYDVGGVGETAQEGKFGYTCKRGDVDALIELTELALERRQTQQDTSEFSEETMIKKYLFLITKF
jgi:glycosyltransferase involved in cell wall biosynthesis